MKKRILSLFLALMLLMCLTPAAAASTERNPFTDVADSDYFFTPVLWAVENSITGGLSPNTFGPSVTCTRGQVVTFLWAAAGKPAPTALQNPFTDVADGQYYHDAVLWAVENGITNGLSPTTFGPDSPCTRSQVVTFLWAAADSPAAAIGNNPFEDVGSGDWFYAPVLWAVHKGITGGLAPTVFGPDSPCTRGQIVTFLYRASESDTAPAPSPADTIVDAYYSRISYDIKGTLPENGDGTAEVTFTAPNLFEIISSCIHKLFTANGSVDEQQAKEDIAHALSAPDAPTTDRVVEAEVEISDTGEVTLTDEAYTSLIMDELEKAFVLAILEGPEHE